MTEATCVMYEFYATYRMKSSTHRL